MIRKRFFSTELAYPLGLLILALGGALMVEADFGVSMVVAPAYLIHLKLSQTLPWFTFGMAEYTLQAVLLIAMFLLLRRFKWSSLFSFATAVIYGFTLDFCLWLVGLVPFAGTVWRIGCYLLGMLLCSVGVSLLQAFSVDIGDIYLSSHIDSFNSNSAAIA